MLPNMNPAQMRKLMQQMGIKNSEIAANRVVIERDEGNLVIENPQVTMIEMGGQKSFQIAGEIVEQANSGQKEASNSRRSDAELVMEKTGCTQEEAEKTLKECNDDIAEAIIKLS